MRAVCVATLAVILSTGCVGRVWNLRAEVKDPARVTILDGDGRPAAIDDPASHLERRPDGSVWHAPPDAPPTIVLHAGPAIESLPRTRPHAIDKIPEPIRFSLTETFEASIPRDEIVSLDDVGHRRGTWRYLIPGLVVALGCGTWLALIDESVAARAMSGACLAGGMVWAGSGAWNLALEPVVVRPILRSER